MQQVAFPVSEYFMIIRKLLKAFPVSNIILCDDLKTAHYCTPNFHTFVLRFISMSEVILFVEAVHL